MKRALPFVVIAVIAVAIVGLVVVLIRAPRGGPIDVPLLHKPTLKPGLHVYDPSGAEVGSGGLTVASGEPFDLRITLEGNAFVYLFDETEGQLSLVWKHAEAEAWEKGEYSAEAPAFEGLGAHKLMVVASPSALANVETWRVISPDALQGACPQCEAASYSFMVSGAIDGGH